MSYYSKNYTGFINCGDDHKIWVSEDDLQIINNKPILRLKFGSTELEPIISLTTENLDFSSKEKYVYKDFSAEKVMFLCSNKK